MVGQKTQVLNSYENKQGKVRREFLAPDSIWATYYKRGEFQQGEKAGKTEQRQDSNVSLFPQLRAGSFLFATSKLIRVQDSLKG